MDLSVLLKIISMVNFMYISHNNNEIPQVKCSNFADITTEAQRPTARKRQNQGALWADRLQGLGLRHQHPPLAIAC